MTPALARCWCCREIIWWVDGRWVHSLMRERSDTPEPHAADPERPERPGVVLFGPDGSPNRRAV